MGLCYTPPMATDRSFHDHIVHDRMHGISGITSRAMFGGWALYRHGKIFGIIADGTLYFKVHEGNRNDFESQESHPFSYEGKQKSTVVMSYWSLPEEILDDETTLLQWIEKSAHPPRR